MPKYLVHFMDYYEGRRRAERTDAPTAQRAISNIKYRLAEEERDMPIKLLPKDDYDQWFAEVIEEDEPEAPAPPPEPRRRRPPEEPTLFNPGSRRTAFGVNPHAGVYDGREMILERSMRELRRNPEETLPTAVPEGLHVVVKPPSEYTADEIQAFKDMILREWQVSDEGLDRRIGACKVLVMIYGPEGLIATGAAKQPYSSYAKKVFAKAGLPGGESEYDFELGYIYVIPERRGILLSRVLMKALLDAVGDASAFATVRTDNERMIRTNHRLGLQETGNPFQSERGPYMLLLFTKKGTRLAFRETEWEESERNPEEWT